jgi:PKD repeat protein
MQKYIRRILKSCFALLVLANLLGGTIGVPIYVIAQEIDEAVELVEESIFQPEIKGGDSVKVGKNIIFSPDVSSLQEGARVLEYLWDFGDAQFSSKEEVVHIYRQPGRYNVKLSVTWVPQEGVGTETVEYMKEVFVFERSLFLMTDLQQTEERISALETRAADQNVYLDHIRAAVNLRLKGQFLQLIEENIDSIQNSDTIIIWSDQVELLSILNTFSQRIEFQQKDLVVITDGNIGLVKNILSGVYSILEPRRIVVTRREAIDEFFTTTEERDVISVIRERGYDLDVIDAQTNQEFDLFALPTYGISYLQEQGVEDSVILAVLFLPVVVTVVTFMRLVVGLSSLGSRMPIIFSYAFLVLGMKVGVVSILLLSLISYLFRRALFKSHLLYTAKVGVLTSILGVVLLFLIGGVMYFEMGTIDFTNVLMLIVLAAMIDRVASIEGEKGLWSTLRVFVETLFISAGAFAVVSWDSLQVLILSHPEILVLFVVANVFMGRFTGLRLMEYFRFREVLRYSEE